ncbi:hypothetical protein [Nocardioides gilvus]|uniref:hypothetical protein n=1 Tax=Nocardioides gilvus TaxID=1735589 RepID=UPI000D74F931|nr:hypothetical protein [Nocardioides gilvus]
MIDRPTSVTLALRIVVALSFMAGMTTVMVAIFRTDLVLAWAEGNAGARQILREGGLAAVERSLTVPGFVPIVVTSFVIFLMLVWVFAVFFREGFTWGRICLGGVAVFGIFLAVLCIASDIPTLFVVLSIVMIVLCAALLVLLLHPDTTRYFREI